MQDAEEDVHVDGQENLGWEGVVTWERQGRPNAAHTLVLPDLQECRKDPQCT